MTMPSEWHDFLIAAAGAAGALAGLVFVALSINLTRILSVARLPGRAAETIILLAAALLGSLILLTPVSARLAGVALLLVAGPAWLVPLQMQWAAWNDGDYPRRSYAIQRSVLHQCATLPGVLSALSLLGFLPWAMAWLAIGIILELAVGLINAWVLLVEIMR